MRKTNRILKILSRLTIGGKKSHFLGYNHIALMLSSILFFSTAIGINFVSLPLVLFQNNVPTSLIGLTAASDIFGGIVIIYFLHKIGKKLGIFNSIFLFSVLAMAMILILPFYQNFVLWFVLSFALGTSIISITTLTNSWINISIRNKIRSMVIAVSSSALCIGLTIGPIIVHFIGAEHYQVFVLSAIFTALGCLILFPIRKTKPKLIVHSRLKLSVFIKRNPKLIIARLLADLQYGTIMFFTVIYGIKSGMSAEDAGLLISVFASVGIFDFLIGFVVNEKSYQKLTVLGFLMLFLTVISLPFAMQNYYLAMLVYLLIGWISSLIIICCWYGANLKRRKDQLIFINSSFEAIGLFGGFFGSLLAGISMQYFGKEGFVVVIAAASLVYLGYVLKSKIKALI
jgi:MFS family permease